MCPGFCRWDTVGEREGGWLGHEDRVIPREIRQERETQGVTAVERLRERVGA